MLGRRLDPLFSKLDALTFDNRPRICTTGPGPWTLAQSPDRCPSPAPQSQSSSEVSGSLIDAGTAGENQLGIAPFTGIQA